MSKRKYPRIGSVSKGLNKHNKKTCLICGDEATHSVDVQWNWFRGDDDVYSVCEDHKRITIEEVLKAV